MLYFIKKFKLYNKLIYANLYYVFGIGFKRSILISAKLGIGKKCRFKKLSKNKLSKLYSIIEKNYLIEDDLRKSLNDTWISLIHLKNYKGIRHKLHLPSRGQRTHSNAKTSRKIFYTLNTLK